jgi:hypothetical protein
LREKNGIFKDLLFLSKIFIKQLNIDISKIICKTLFLFPIYLRENIKNEFKRSIQRIFAKHKNMKIIIPFLLLFYDFFERNVRLLPQ